MRRRIQEALGIDDLMVLANRTLGGMDTLFPLLAADARRRVPGSHPVPDFRQADPIAHDVALCSRDEQQAALNSPRCN